ncbi:MAG: hypothetical protein ACLP56_02845, partial [Candidatus Sulfotelmatobacter sp.]
MAGGRGEAELRQFERVASGIVHAGGVGGEWQLSGSGARRRSDIEGEPDFGVAASSFPASFERAGSESRWMQSREGMSGKIECGSQLFSGDIAQAKNDQRPLDSGRLGFGDWLAGFVQ